LRASADAQRVLRSTALRSGSQEIPNRSPKLVLRVRACGGVLPSKLRGPGLSTARCVALPRPNSRPVRTAPVNAALFPRGIGRRDGRRRFPIVEIRAPRGSPRRETAQYVAVKGGERAIEKRKRIAWLAHERRGDREWFRNLSMDQRPEQLALGVDRVMTRGSLV